MSPLPLTLHSKQQGFLLLEYLVALALFLCVLLSVDAVFALHFRIKQVVETQSNSITTLRQLALQLQPVIEQAGYSGCQRFHNPVDVLYAVAGTWQPSLPSALKGKVAKESDILLLKGAQGWSVSLQKSMQNKQDKLLLPWVNVAETDYYIIDDCTHTEIFSANAIVLYDTVVLEPNQPLNHVYTQQAAVSPYRERVYYLNPDFNLQVKDILPESAAYTLHNDVKAWRLKLQKGLVEIKLETTEIFQLWFKY